MAKVDHAIGELGRVKDRIDELNATLGELFVDVDATVKALEQTGLIVGLDFGELVGGAHVAYVERKRQAWLESDEPIADDEVFGLPVHVDGTLDAAVAELRGPGGRLVARISELDTDDPKVER